MIETASGHCRPESSDMVGFVCVETEEWGRVGGVRVESKGQGWAGALMAGDNRCVSKSKQRKSAHFWVLSLAHSGPGSLIQS